ncbi:hypothetical protein WMF01_35690 [Sorangium sp. So ce1667]
MDFLNSGIRPILTVLKRALDPNRSSRRQVRLLAAQHPAMRYAVDQNDGRVDVQPLQLLGDEISLDLRHFVAKVALERAEVTSGRLALALLDEGLQHLERFSLCTRSSLRCSRRRSLRHTKNSSDQRRQILTRPPTLSPGAPQSVEKLNKIESV